MNIRERIEAEEEMILSDRACLSKNSLGRRYPEEESELRTVFQRDRDRIIHSKAFRRLKHKTQVFIVSEQDNYRTRLTHTLEVSQIARTIARALRLNEDLIEAISLGHDLGHTPFGHSGEAVLNSLHPHGFKHYEQSVRVVRFLEKRSTEYGLNLTYEVIDGIANHSKDLKAHTEEGQIVKYADRIAYINHDIDDALQANVISIEDIPEELLNILGYTHAGRIDTLIKDLVYTSLNSDEIRMSDPIYNAMMKLREFMFENVYFNPQVKSGDDRIYKIISDLYNYYLRDLSRLPDSHLDIYKNIDDTNIIDEDIVCDYIASMTDTYIVKVWKEVFST